MVDIDDAKLKARTISFWSALAYVGCGLLSAWALFSDTFGDNDFVFIIVGAIVLVTLPVYLLTFPVAWGGFDISVLVITEIIIFVIFWFTFNRYMFNKYKRILKRNKHTLDN